MRGDLSRTSAADACRELARQAATGLLAIEGPEGPGSVSMIEGRIVAASSPTPRSRLGDRLVGASYLDEQDLAEALRLQRSGEDHARLGVLLVERGLVSRDAVRLFIQEQMLDALFDVLFWRYGSFEFIQGEATEVLEVPLSIAVDDMLVEVARRQQEWEQVRQVIPDLESVPDFRVGASSASAALEPDEFAILASVDGERSVRALANDLGYGEFEAARIVYGLCLLGIVEVRLPEDEVGAAFDDAFAAPSGDGDTPEIAGQPDPADVGEPQAAVSDPVIPIERDPVDEQAAAQLDTDLSDLLAELTGARGEGDEADGDEADGDEADEPAPFSATIDDPDATAASWQRGGAWTDGHHEPEPPAPSRTWAIDDPDGGAVGWAPPDQPEPAADLPAPDEDPEPTADLPTPVQPDAQRGDPDRAPPVRPDRDPAAADMADDATDDTTELQPVGEQPQDAGQQPQDAGEQPQDAGDRRPPAPWSPRPAQDEAAPPRDDQRTDRDGPDALPARPSQRGGGPGSTFVEDPVPAAGTREDEPFLEPAGARGNEPDRAWHSGDAGDDDAEHDDAEHDDAEHHDDAATSEEERSTASREVSEFLRELSRLALDDGDESDRPRPAPSSPRNPRPPADDDKPKKRGLFGWGS